MKSVDPLNWIFSRTSSWRVPAAILLITSILAVVLKPVLDGEVSSGLIFVVGITLVGANSGLMPAIVCAVASSAIFNFFLAQPTLAFRLTTGSDLAPPIIYTACAVASGLLSGWLRDRTAQLGTTNIQLERLLEMSRNLQRSTSETDVAEALAALPNITGAALELYREDGGAVLPLGDTYHARWLEVARRTLESGQEVMRSKELTGYALSGSSGVVGALVSDEGAGRSHDQSFMLALAQILGLTLERARLAAVIAEKEASTRTEELKSALLSSVSHDLRTPLTAISASASSLIEYGTRLDSDTSRLLLQSIVDECERLNRFTSNLLELSRLQAGGIDLLGMKLSVNDVMHSVVQRLRTRFPDRDITVIPGYQDALVMADSTLFELALTNVIQNALHYSDLGAPVCVECRLEGDTCTLSVTDHGPGIPEADQHHVFERFYRVKRSESSPQGSGLGLAIAKGFVEAFGGTIELTSPVSDGLGTCVTIRLPKIRESVT